MKIIIKGNKKDVNSILKSLAEKNKGKTVQEFLNEMNQNFKKDEIVLC